MPLVPPEPRPGPAEPRLHLVGDVEPARLPRQRRHPRERAGRGRRQHPVGGEDRVGQERRQPHPVPLQFRDRGRHPGREIDPGSRRGHRPHVRPERNPTAQAGGELRHRGGHPVVRVRGHDDPGAAGVEPGDAQRQVVGLAPGAGEHRVGRADRVRRQQPLGVPDDPVGEVPGVRVEGRQLPRDRRGDRRVRVPDRRHVVIRVEVRHPVRVVQVHAGAARELDRLVVEQPVGAAEGGLPAGDQLPRRGREPGQPRPVVPVDHQRDRREAVRHDATSSSQAAARRRPIS